MRGSKRISYESCDTITIEYRWGNSYAPNLGHTLNFGFFTGQSTNDTFIYVDEEKVIAMKTGEMLTSYRKKKKPIQTNDKFMLKFDFKESKYHIYHQGEERLCDSIENSDNKPFVIPYVVLRGKKEQWEITRCEFSSNKSQQTS